MVNESDSVIATKCQITQSVGIGKSVRRHAGLGHDVRVKQFRHPVVRFDLRGIGIPYQSQRLYKCSRRSRPVDIGVGDLMGIEIADGAIDFGQRRHAFEQIELALKWSKAAGIMNWGYFILGLPGETEETIRETLDLSKKLPLDLALFLDLAQRAGQSGNQEWLSFYWKSPHADSERPEHDIFIQQTKLKNTLREWMGEQPVTHSEAG